ncbi:MAG: hypothetical protein Q9204_007668 [Flavoplaca sp. TL-2023a]
MAEPEQILQAIAEPEPHTPPLAWFIWGVEHCNHPDRPEEFRATYLLAKKFPKKDNVLIMSLKLSSSTSPYTYHGAIRAKPDDLTELDHPEGRRRLASFEIQGSGTWKKRDKNSVDFESEFQVVEGTGRKEFEGITGSGRLWVDMDVLRLYHQSRTLINHTHAPTNLITTYINQTPTSFNPPKHTNPPATPKRLSSLIIILHLQLPLSTKPFKPLASASRNDFKGAFEDL